MAVIETFDERTVQRILASVRYYERMVRGGGDGRARWPVLSPEGLILCRISTGGFTARVKDSPTTGKDTLGTGMVRRYETDADGLVIELADDEEAATSSYFAVIAGDFDGWFTDLGGKLSLVSRHCLNA